MRVGVLGTRVFGPAVATRVGEPGHRPSSGSRSAAGGALGRLETAELDVAIAR